jgi:hypothetical protein
MDEQARNRKNAKARERYQNDAEYREKIKAHRQERYATDELFREKRRADGRKRYANNAEYRARRKARQRERYATDSEYRAKRKTKGRVQRLKHKYGLTTEQFNELLHQQNHACGICERPFHRTPHIDHCHVTGLVRGLLCHTCNVGLGHFDDNPALLVKAARYLARWLLRVLQILNRKENDMMTTDDSGDGKASQMMRQAILHELRQPFGVDEPPPADKLQAVARALVTKAVAHDVLAIKEILECINAKTPSAPIINDLSQLANLSWKQAESPSKLSPSKMPPAKLSPSKPSPAKPSPSKPSPSKPSPSKKSKSTTGRARNSSPSTHDPSASPAS